MLALYVHCIELSHRLRRDSKAVTALEYGMIAALIAVVIIGALTTLGGKLTTTFAAVSAALPGG